MPSVNDFNEELPRAITPTPEQLAIIQAVTTTKDNLLISALAGAAKTSTLVLIAEALPQTAMLCLAFNKKIAVEMGKRLPSTCVAKTLNSLGHSAWAKFINKKFLEVDEKKTFRLVKESIEATDDKKEKSFLYGQMATIMRAVDAGKTCGYIPNGHFPHAKGLMNDEEFFAWLDEEPSSAEKSVIIDVTLKSLKEAFDGHIDFNDQILMPTVFPASFVQYPITLVDEAQDLSELNHVMLGKVVGHKRIIAVGDECQAIYGFRGAHENSMDLLRRTFNMKQFILSVSFRCPIKVVEEARWRAPHMRYPDWATAGVVTRLRGWGIDDIPEFSAIICRNNAPLFSMAIKLLKSGRYPELVGNDIGKVLLKTLKSLGKLDMPRTEVLNEIDHWTTEKLRKARSPNKIHDQADCLRIFAEQGKTLGEAITYAEHILAASGPIKLMTGHKSKGLEFDDVFFLDEDLIGQEQQEHNLKYVIQTRAKRTLTYVASAEFVFPEVTNEAA